jgi:hypothetical protein
MTNSATQVAVTNLNQAIDGYLRNKQIDRDYDWKRSISFFGRVVDQNGNPVEGAMVSLQWVDMSAAGTSKTIKTTDAKGYFALKNVIGKNLSVVLTKQGYSSARTNQYVFEYADPGMPYFHVPDPSNPVVFCLYKHRQEELIHGTFRARFSHDGKPTSVALPAVNGTSIGSLRIDRKAEERTVENPMPLWSAIVTHEGAMITPANEEFPYNAPLEGYQPSVSIQETERGHEWKAKCDLNLFFRLTSPEVYGRTRIIFFAWGDSIDIEYWVNLSGGRSLDPGAP